MNWLNKLKTEFKRRVLERHYRLVEFSKQAVGAKWWSIQKLGTTGWKEVETEWTYEDAERGLIDMSQLPNFHAFSMIVM